MLAIELDFYDQKRRRVIEVATFLPMDDQGRVNAKDKARALRDAADLLAERKRQVKKNEFVHPDDVKAAEAAAALERAARSLTFEDFGKRFLADYAAAKRSTFYEGRVKSLTRVFGHRPVREITRAELDQFAAKRLREVKASTVRRELAVLAVMFKMARRWEVIEHSPAVDLVRPKEPPHKTRYLSRDEWEALAGSAPPWLKPILTLTVLTGLRLKEVVGLRWDGYDKAAGVIHLSGDNKTESVRAVPLNTEARRLVDERHAAREAKRRDHARLTGSVPPAGAYVFTDDDGQPYTSARARNEISKATIAAMRAAGIRDASFHTLRHTAATWMVRARVPLFEVQRILGHSTPLMTQRYASLNTDDLRSATEALASAFRGDAVADGNRLEQKPAEDGRAIEDSSASRSVVTS